MASIAPRKGRTGVYAYYFEKNTGKQVQIPRKLTKHLDIVPHEQALQWIKDWEEEHGIAKDRSKRFRLDENDPLQSIFEKYRSHRKNTNKNKTETTLDAERQLFETYIFPFFVGQHGRKKPDTWHNLVVDFHVEMFSKKDISQDTIKRVLWALKRFGKFLVFCRLMPIGFAIETPAARKKKVTPLKVRLTPADVLRFVKQGFKDFDFKGREVTIEQMKLAVLIGYFATLRPQESFALNKEDFLTGAQAIKDCKTYEGFTKHKLGTKLSIIVDKAWNRDKKGPMVIGMTKTEGSMGIINVFDQDAAKEIAGLLKIFPNGRLFPITYSGMMQVWSDLVKEHLKVTAHDLRRASCLYLGRTIRVEVTLLQEHARHSDLATTMLYCRDPQKPEVDRISILQDFDAI